MSDTDRDTDRIRRLMTCKTKSGISLFVWSHTVLGSIFVSQPQLVAEAMSVSGDASSHRGLPEVPPPPLRPLGASDIFVDGVPDCDAMRRHLYLGGRLEVSAVLYLLSEVRQILMEEPNVLELDDPITVCGDIHGQYYDLMTLFNLGGHPDKTQYLFLGDYVDRGCFSTEVALYLFSLKLRRPDQFWMIRGNHECRHLTMYFNFKEECLHKYGEEVYDAFQNTFDTLPLAALLDGVFLCVHGGLSPEIKTVDDISLIDRFTEPPTSGTMCDVLWADPMEDEEESLCPNALFLHNGMRGCSYVFSSSAVEAFLKSNGLLSVIRAHEAQDEGYRFFRRSPDTGFPSVICVFSAPNYCDSYGNKAAIIQITDKVVQVKQFHAVDHPYVLQNFLNAFSWSLPFMYEKIADATAIMAGVNRNDPSSKLPSIAVDVHGNIVLSSHLPSVLERRGKIMLAKTRAVVRFRRLLAMVRLQRLKKADK